jgi:hypothetical protein
MVLISNLSGIKNFAKWMGGFGDWPEIWKRETGMQ